MTLAFIPKDVFARTDVLEIGVCDAVSHFNIGSQAALNVLTNSGIYPGEYFTKEIWKADRKASYKERDLSKKKRKVNC